MSRAFPPMPADARGGNLSLAIPMAPEPGAASPDALLLSSTFVGRGAGKECQGMVLTTQFSRVWQGFCVSPTSFALLVLAAVVPVPLPVAFPACDSSPGNS